MRLVNSYESPALAIYTELPRTHAYNPGDWITGRVSRLDKIVVPDAELTIQFNGMTAVATNAFARGYDIKRPSHQSEFLSSTRFDFFTDGRDETCRQTFRRLHAGPLRVDGGPNTGATWEFRVQIPYTTGIDTRDPNIHARPSYLSLAPDEVQRHRLPATSEPFVLNAQVGYHLCAQLTYTDYGKRQCDGSILEILVKSGNKPDLISNNNSKTKGWMKTASSYTMAHGMSSGSSFKQRTKQFLKTSTVPKLTYEIAFSMPGTLQLHHPDYLPFSIRLRTNVGETSGSLRDVPILATITDMRLTLIKITEIVAGAPADWHEAKSHGYDEISMDLGLRRIFERPSEHLKLQITPTATPLHIGKLFALRLQPDGLYSGKLRLGELALIPPIEPAFVTYNLKAHYKIKYEVDIDVAGEVTTVSEATKVDMIAPVGEGLAPVAGPAYTADGLGNAYDEFSSDYADPAYDEIGGAAGIAYSLWESERPANSRR